MELMTNSLLGAYTVPNLKALDKKFTEAENRKKKYNFTHKYI